MPSTHPRTTRRALLATGVTGLGSLAGCTSTSTSTSLTAPRRQRWSYGTGGASVVGEPAVADGTVLLATRESGSGRLHAVDAATGERAWRADVPVPRSSPRARDGLVGLGTADGLVALDATSGEERWRALTDSHVGGVAATDDAFYARTARGAVVALDAAGEERWTADPGATGPLAVGIGAVVTAVSTNGGDVLVVFHPETGAERWRTDEGSSRPLRAAVGGDRVYAAGDRVVAHDATTGRERWVFDPGERESVSTAPVPVDGGVHVGTGVRFTDRDYGTVFALFDGRAGYEFRAEGSVSALAGDADGLFAAVGESVHAIDPETMAGRWSAEVGRASLAASGGVCYAARDSGRLVALADE